MVTIRPNKWMSVKTWETLEKECNTEGLTSLLCCQDFNATKEDSFEDNGWGEVDEDGFIIGDSENFDYETAWKHDTMFRMLDENLDYGKYSETEEELDDDDGLTHSALMDLRCTIADEVAWAWIALDNGYGKGHPKHCVNEVYNMETAQKMADELVEKYDLKDFMPITDQNYKKGGFKSPFYLFNRVKSL